MVMIAMSPARVRRLTIQLYAEWSEATLPRILYAPQVGHVINFHFRIQRLRLWLYKINYLRSYQKTNFAYISPPG
jgi:hypothetical protein